MESFIFVLLLIFGAASVFILSVFLGFLLYNTLYFFIGFLRNKWRGQGGLEFDDVLGNPTQKKHILGYSISIFLCAFGIIISEGFYNFSFIEALFNFLFIVFLLWLIATYLLSRIEQKKSILLEKKIIVKEPPTISTIQKTNIASTSTPQSEDHVKKKSDNIILIIEDGYDIRETLKTYLHLRLNNKNLSIVEILDGEIAWDYIQNYSKRVAIIISDIRHPGLDGIELLKRCKNIYPKIPFIIQSSFLNKKNLLECESLTKYVIEKPMNLEKIYFVVQLELANKEYN